MTPAVGRLGGWAVGIAVAALIFEPPNRLTAQDSQFGEYPATEKRTN